MVWYVIAHKEQSETIIVLIRLQTFSFNNRSDCRVFPGDNKAHNDVDYVNTSWYSRQRDTDYENNKPVRNRLHLRQSDFLFLAQLYLIILMIHSSPCQRTCTHNVVRYTCDFIPNSTNANMTEQVLWSDSRGAPKVRVLPNLVQNWTKSIRKKYEFDSFLFGSAAHILGTHVKVS